MEGTENVSRDSWQVHVLRVMRRVLLRGFVLVTAIVGCRAAPDLADGQVWSYKTRAGEGASTIQVLHIEPATALGDIVFVSIRGVHEEKPGGGKLRVAEVWPIAFTRDACWQASRDINTASR